jgi:hypothetical protein
MKPGGSADIIEVFPSVEEFKFILGYDDPNPNIPLAFYGLDNNLFCYCAPGEYEILYILDYNINVRHNGLEVPWKSSAIFGNLLVAKLKNNEYTSITEQDYEFFLRQIEDKP